MDSFHRRRRDLLWILGGIVYYEKGLDLEVPIELVELPELSELGKMLWEYELLGLAPDRQLMSIYRDRLRVRGVLSSLELASRPSGEDVCVAGVVVVRQRPPSAKGYVFVTLEDEEGLSNLVLEPTVYERYKNVLRNAVLLVAEGRLQREGQVTNILIHRLTRFSG
jgi:error-prone DNA polymerase